MMRYMTWRLECFAPGCAVGGVGIVGIDTC